ncbi:hypothetical protein B0T20DRAFT_320034, partial [Sordaria brevicollis]
LTYEGHPLKLLPIPQLAGDFSNFRQWTHAVRFHLTYFKLTDFVNAFPTNKLAPSNETEREILELRSLHAYSIIASKMESKGVSDAFVRVLNRELFLNKDDEFHYSPAKLWNDIH